MNYIHPDTLAEMTGDYEATGHAPPQPIEPEPEPAWFMGFMLLAAIGFTLAFAWAGLR